MIRGSKFAENSWLFTKYKRDIKNPRVICDNSYIYLEVGYTTTATKLVPMPTPTPSLLPLTTLLSHKPTMNCSAHEKGPKRCFIIVWALVIDCPRVGPGPCGPGSRPDHRGRSEGLGQIVAEWTGHGGFQGQKLDGPDLEGSRARS